MMGRLTVDVYEETTLYAGGDGGDGGCDGGGSDGGFFDATYDAGYDAGISTPNSTLRSTPAVAEVVSKDGSRASPDEPVGRSALAGAKPVPAHSRDRTSRTWRPVRRGPGGADAVAGFGQEGKWVPDERQRMVGAYSDVARHARCANRG